jgi:hypothetical protein
MIFRVVGSMAAKASSVGATKVKGPVWKFIFNLMWVRIITVRNLTWAGKCVYKASFGHQIQQLCQSIFLQNGWNIVTASVTLNISIAIFLGRCWFIYLNFWKFLLPCTTKSIERIPKWNQQPEELQQQQQVERYSSSTFGWLEPTEWIGVEFLCFYSRFSI